MDEVLTERRVGGQIEFAHMSGAGIRFDQVAPVRAGVRTGLQAWIEAFVEGEGLPVHSASYDLMGSRTVSQIVQFSAGRANKMPWQEIVSEAVYRVIRSHQEGEPPVRLGEIEAPDGIRWLIEPLVEEGGPTLLVAAGGTAKSYLCLATAVAVATGKPLVGDLAPSKIGPVLYLDWEADRDTHAYRLKRICNGAGLDPMDVDVYYRRETQPLTRSAHQIARMCDELGVVFVVIDSVMLARGGDAFGPEETIGLFAAIREIGRPSLLADHKSKEAIAKGQRGAYGTVVSENSARRVWDIRPGFEEPGRKTIWLENTKANNSPRHEPIAFTFCWTEEPLAVNIEQVPATGVLPTRRTDDAATWQSLVGVLADNDPLTVDEIADQLSSGGIDKSPSVIRVTLNRHPDRFHNVGSQSKGLWTLSAPDVGLFDGDQAF